MTSAPHAQRQCPELREYAGQARKERYEVKIMRHGTARTAGEVRWLRGMVCKSQGGRQAHGWLGRPCWRSRGNVVESRVLEWQCFKHGRRSRRREDEWEPWGAGAPGQSRRRRASGHRFGQGSLGRSPCSPWAEPIRAAAALTQIETRLLGPRLSTLQPNAGRVTPGSCRAMGGVATPSIGLWLFGET